MTANTVSKRYMLDTNIFDALVKGWLTVDRFPSDGTLCATHVQLEELKNTKDSERRSRLSETFTKIITATGVTLDAGFAFDIAGAGLNQGVWRSDGALYRALKNGLDEAWERKSKRDQRRSKKENNAKDALIAEAAKFNDCTLLTRDRDLATVAANHGIGVMQLNADGSPRAY